MYIESSYSYTTLISQFTFAIRHHKLIPEARHSLKKPRSGKTRSHGIDDLRISQLNFATFHEFVDVALDLQKQLYLHVIYSKDSSRKCPIARADIVPFFSVFSSIEVALEFRQLAGAKYLDSLLLDDLLHT